MKKLFLFPLFLLAAALMASCDDDTVNHDPGNGHNPDAKAVFIVNEGNYGNTNSSLSYYEPETGTLTADVFSDVNGMKLGNSATSMTIHNGKGYICVGASNVVMVIDLRTFEAIGQVTGLTSPRYIRFLSDDKAYVTDLTSGKITVFNPKNYRVTGHIDLPAHPSTEQIVQAGDYIYVNCWSFDNKILVIDPQSDEVVDEIEVGVQPQSMILDRAGKIWCLCDGGYEGNPVGFEPPSIWIIDPATRSVEATLTFPENSVAKPIRTDAAGSTIYYILDGEVYSLSADSRRLPSEPVVKSKGGTFYGLGIDPENGDIYVSDVLDYAQPGLAYRFRSNGQALDTLRVGIIPGDFCFKPESR